MSISLNQGNIMTEFIALTYGFQSAASTKPAGCCVRAAPFKSMACGIADA
jgi:hypothetical protein